MPLIKPFCGLRYDVKKVGALSKVLTPPYDIIDPDEQKAYYKKHPSNFIRLDFALEKQGDSSKSNRYTRARETYASWVKRGILKQDDVPSVYPHVQEYKLDGKKYQRWGVIGLVPLDSDLILPHEHTRPKPKQDRVKLLEAVRVSLSPLFGMVKDPSGDYKRYLSRRYNKQRPVTSVTIDGVAHKFWKETDPKVIAKLNTLLRRRPMVIADGHHRCEASRIFLEKQQKRLAKAGVKSYQDAMFYVSAAEGNDEPGLLPTHRVLSGIPEKKLLKLLETQTLKYGKITQFQSVQELLDRIKWLTSRNRIGVGLITRKGKPVLFEAKAKMPYDLDVEWLHGEILEPWMTTKTEIRYIHDLPRARRLVRQGEGDALFVLQPPRLGDVFKKAKTAGRMPAKTTYFYPKPLAGFVSFPFDPINT